MAKFTFLGLPGEIRNQIYEELLTVSRPGIPRALGATSRLHPQILSACRQVNREACLILYGLNTFIAHWSLLSKMPRLRPWHDPVRSTNLIAMIRRYHVYVRLDCDAHFTAVAARDAFTGVEFLTVEVFQAQFGSSDFSVLERFEDIRGVKKAKITGSVTGFPMYVNWLECIMMSPEGTIVPDFDEDQMQRTEARDIWTDNGR